MCARVKQDYLVLLPSAYYEAPILQMRVTEPCTYGSAPYASDKYGLSAKCHEAAGWSIECFAFDSSVVAALRNIFLRHMFSHRSLA